MNRKTLFRFLVPLLIGVATPVVHGQGQDLRISESDYAGRTILNGKCDGDVGNTVNVANASYTNDIGSAALAGHWTDPEFNPDQRAFYYVRVLEIPTPRWTAYDAKYFQIEMPEGAPMEVIDRGYSSPIWYAPQS